MSKYKLIEHKIQTEEAAVEAIIAMGVPREAVLVSNSPANLEGYRGDQRREKAQIIVRRKDVDKYLSGGASNDFGIEFTKEGSKIHISDYDHSWWRKKQSIFKQTAIEVDISLKAKKKGYRIKKRKEGKKIVLTVEKLY